MRQMIGAGSESHGLYCLQPPSSIVYSIVESPKLFHYHVGHPSLKYESCQHRKHAHSTFPIKVNNHATSPFSTIHFDVLGPSCVISISGYRYFVTFIDDF